MFLMKLKCLGNMSLMRLIECWRISKQRLAVSINVFYTIVSEIDTIVLITRVLTHSLLEILPKIAF